MKISQLTFYLKENFQNNKELGGDLPQAIVFHCSTSDIGSTSYEMDKYINWLLDVLHEILTMVKALLPKTYLIWSDVLSRYKYSGFPEKDLKHGHMLINNISAQVQCFMCLVNLGYITHPHINPAQKTLFQFAQDLQDKVHLLDAGYRLFLTEIAQYLMFEMPCL